MSFGEKVKARLVALESQVSALDARLKALEPKPQLQVVHTVLPADVYVTPLSTPVKRKPGRPRKIVNA